MTPRTHNGADGSDGALAAARGRAEELGCGAVGAETAAMLRFLACSLRARAVVEIGTGTGVSGLHLLAGMVADGVLTSIDIEAECQRLARRGFADAGYAPGRSRLITGRALEVLPRLSPGGYDLVFVDASGVEYPRYHEAAVPLLRRGGVLAFHGVSGGDADGDGDGDGDGDETSRALRLLSNAVRRDDRLIPAFVPQPAPLLLAALAVPG